MNGENNPVHSDQTRTTEWDNLAREGSAPESSANRPREIVELREYEPGDNIQEVAKLVYDTDPYIYPYMFDGNRDVAERVVAEMINNPDTPYAAENLRVATNQDNEIVGLLVAFAAPIDVNLDAMRESFAKAGVEITPAVENTLQEYYKGQEEEPAGNICILNLCVDNAHRGNGIGGQMLDQFLQDDKSYHLDALADNESAVRLYKSRGFETYEECRGFGGDKPAPAVIRMERKIRSQEA